MILGEVPYMGPLNMSKLFAGQDEQREATYVAAQYGPDVLPSDQEEQPLADSKSAVTD